jgi:hypothetical protein
VSIENKKPTVYHTHTTGKDISCISNTHTPKIFPALFKVPDISCKSAGNIQQFTNSLHRWLLLTPIEIPSAKTPWRDPTGGHERQFSCAICHSLDLVAPPDLCE